jgi:hypothetical protein
MSRETLGDCASDNATAATNWTSDMVEARLKEAASVLARLPAAKTDAYLGLLAQDSFAKQRKHGWDVYVNRHGLPKAHEIARMEEALTWFHCLTSNEQRLVWMRATGLQWKIVCGRIRCSRTEAWRQWTAAMNKIIARLDRATTYGQIRSVETQFVYGSSRQI